MKEERTLHTLILMAFLTISAYFLADTVDAVIGKSLSAAPQAVSPLDRANRRLEPKREMSDYASILDRGLFGEGRAPSAGSAAEATAFRLIGTVAGDAFAGAVLEDPAGVQTFYRRGEKLPDGFELAVVKRDRVSLKKPSGGMVELQIIEDSRIVSVAKASAPAAGGVRRVANDTWVLDQREVAASTENMSQILTQARALPFMDDGKTIGFRITEIVPNSIYDKIGLQNGDVIQKINSMDVDDPGKFFQMYQGLKDERAIAIDVMRNGQRQTLNYEIR